MSEPAQNRLKLDRFTHHSDKNMLGEFHNGARHCSARSAVLRKCANAATRILALTPPLHPKSAILQHESSVDDSSVAEKDFPLLPWEDDFRYARRYEVTLTHENPKLRSLAVFDDHLVGWQGRPTDMPSKLWLIGLGNLGQAFSWLLACLPYADRGRVQLLLQDFDRLAPSNDSTSLLSLLRDAGRRKARVVAAWLDERGFETFVEERRFGPWTKRAPHEPGVALCGVDNALARAALEKPGFDLVVEAGLGAGPQAFRSFSMHTFPASRSAEEIWSRQVAAADENFEDRPAYQALRQGGMDQCGLAQLASRTVGVPFVGLIAAAIAVSELLRRLHGGAALELASGSVAALQDVEALNIAAPPYPGAYVEVSAPSPDRSLPAGHAQTFEALNPGFETVPAD